ncbi:MAG: hypothetical protein JW757_14285 [Anaerolineales bacterium]|nr:hypothetical protein [Anaerolineales bacterium]
MPTDTLRENLYRVGMQGVKFALPFPDSAIKTQLIESLFGNFFKNMINAAVTFDEMIVENSLNEACGWISSICGAPPRVFGAENLPVDGPVLVTSNHPGYFEGMLTISQLPRDDLKLVVGGIPYFNQLPNTSNYIFYTDHTESENVQVLRKAVSHLKNHGLLMIYPTGQADPDPDSMRGAFARFDAWSESVSLLLRRVPETSLVIVIVSGIVNPRFMRNPLTWIPRQRRARIRVAELLQLYRQFGQPNCHPLSSPRISFSQPVSGADLIAQVGKKNLMTEIIRRAKTEHQTHMARRER